jgi:hypothetical protein
MKKAIHVFVSLLLILIFPHCGYAQSIVLKDSLLIPFQNQLLSASPMIQKNGIGFYLYDLVSEKLFFADRELNLLKQITTKLSIENASKEKRKSFYKNMYASKDNIYLITGGTVQRYSSDLVKLTKHLLSYKNSTLSLRNIQVPDVGFLVEESKGLNYYIIRMYIASTFNLDYLEVYTKGFYQRPTYALFEKNAEDTTQTPIKKMIIPYDEIYQEKIPLGYVYSQGITWGKKKTIITTEGATEKIRIYNMEGKEVEVFGEKGKYMTKKDTIPYLPYPQDSSATFWEKMDKKIKFYQQVNPFYGQAYYDAETERIYREYTPSIDMNEQRKRFIQVYERKKLIADVPFFIGQRIIAIENDVIYTYQINNDGETPPKYIYKFKLQ